MKTLVPQLHVAALFMQLLARYECRGKNNSQTAKHGPLGRKITLFESSGAGLRIALRTAFLRAFETIMQDPRQALNRRFFTHLDQFRVLAYVLDAHVLAHGTLHLQNFRDLSFC